MAHQSFKICASNRVANFKKSRRCRLCRLWYNSFYVWCKSK